MEYRNCYVLADKPPRFYEELLQELGLASVKVYKRSSFKGYRLLSVPARDWDRAEEALRPYLLREE